MSKICPKCGSIAEYNAYYGRTTCTSCEWESEKNKNQKRIFIVNKTKKPKLTKLDLVKADC